MATANAEVTVHVTVSDLLSGWLKPVSLTLDSMARCDVCRRSLNPACDTGHVCVDCEGKGLSRKTGSILDALKECYEAGGKAWDNPDVTLREIREG